ncbi:MAG: hypothetical protein H6868_10440 [Rhodospirillales bacterium]|nr:hypothetical protein [Rhodospirillales bacterium]MCB9989729.1 hypothetical protein [Rhodospirillales bacterium]
MDLVLGIVAVVFSFLAYMHARERFRLDLLEKRWQVYEKVLEFCSRVTEYGGLPKHGDDGDRNQAIINALIAANESFRGIGYHKARSLFGPEIHRKFDELSKAYAFFVTYSDISHDKIDEKHKKLMFVWETIKELPDLFKPYVYFGDFKHYTFKERVDLAKSKIQELTVFRKEDIK